VRHHVDHSIEHVRRDHMAGFSPQLDDSADPAHGSSKASWDSNAGRRPIGGTGNPTLAGRLARSRPAECRQGEAEIDNSPSMGVVLNPQLDRRTAMRHKPFT
jgi:hypothetical protein